MVVVGGITIDIFWVKIIFFNCVFLSHWEYIAISRWKLQECLWGWKWLLFIC